MANCNSKPKKMKKGGTPSPIPMPKEVKERRANRRTRNDKTDALSREQLKAIGYSEAQLKKMGMKDGGMARTLSDADKDIIRQITGSTTKAISDADRDMFNALKASVKSKSGGKVKGYKNGGCVMSGRGGKFKGIS